MDRVLQAILRTDLPSFIRKVFATVSPGEAYCHNWHVEAIACQLMPVQQGQTLRLLINQPPRSLKSICISVAYVAWTLGQDPTRRFIVASYSGDFAAELHRQFRQVVKSAWYAELFPGTQWEVARKKVIDWYGGTLVSRLNDKRTGAIIAVMQRLHEDDLAGHLLRQGGWAHLDMPAIALEDEAVDLGHGKIHLRRVGDVLHPERESLGRGDHLTI